MLLIVGNAKCCVQKTLFLQIMNEKKATAFVPCKPFHSMPMHVGKAKFLVQKTLFLQLMNESISYSVRPLQAFPPNAVDCGQFQVLC
jgi:hypothetical protein